MERKLSKRFHKEKLLNPDLYNNAIDIAILCETMLSDKDKFFVKGYRIYRANAKTRKGVAILISNSLCCDSYKTMTDDEGRYLQVKLKDAIAERTISAGYVEPENQHIAYYQKPL